WRYKPCRESSYIGLADSDENIAQAIAADLERSGIASWLNDESDRSVQWAGGVQPALTECGSLVVLLSPATLDSQAVQAAWQFFKDKRKPVLIAQVDAADPPDATRRSPRFDFSADSKAALLQLVQALDRKIFV